jgi:hypothetical protein
LVLPATGIGMVIEACCKMLGADDGPPGKTAVGVGIICGAAQTKLAQRSSVRDRSDTYTIMKDIKKDSLRDCKSNETDLNCGISSE